MTPVRSPSSVLQHPPEHDRADAYIGAGARSLHPRFKAGFIDAVENVDHTTVNVELLRATGFAGITAPVGDHLRRRARSNIPGVIPYCRLKKRVKCA